MVVVRNAFATEHPDAVAQFLADYEASTEFVNANPAEAAPLIVAAGIVPERDARRGGHPALQHRRSSTAPRCGRRSAGTCRCCSTPTRRPWAGACREMTSTTAAKTPHRPSSAAMSLPRCSARRVLAGGVAGRRRRRRTGILLASPAQVVARLGRARRHGGLLARRSRPLVRIASGFTAAAMRRGGARRARGRLARRRRARRPAHRDDPQRAGRQLHHPGAAVGGQQHARRVYRASSWCCPSCTRTCSRGSATATARCSRRRRCSACRCRAGVRGDRRPRRAAVLRRRRAGSGVGLAWKSGVAAEVIGVATGAIGERLYEAKIFLELRRPVRVDRRHRRAERRLRAAACSGSALRARRALTPRGRS